jgi:colanic acid biosynthesis glycosyl transferase WcaI
VDTASIRPVARENNGFLRRVPEIEGKFVVLYSGNLGFLHGLDALLDAAASLQDLPEVVFVIVGSGQRRAALEARATAEGSRNVHFFDFQPFSLVADVYSAGDICLVPMRKGATNTAIPSKIWTIMAAGRPLLAAIEKETELARLILELDVGRVVDPEDGAALAAEIRRMHASPEERERLGKNGRNYVETHLCRSRVMSRYLKIFVDLTGLAAEGEGARVPSERS